MTTEKSRAVRTRDQRAGIAWGYSLDDRDRVWKAISEFEAPTIE